jgi:DNA polymerase III, gamma/tau subunits
MLSTQAWNAFLKTLEEPPSHALFILATTELHKVPETILSRCQTVQFARPSAATLKTMVEQVAQKEGYTLEPASSDLIALCADGSFRDAHGVLQRVLTTTTGKTVHAAEVERVLGAPASAEVLRVVEALAVGDADAALTAVRTLSRGKEPRLVLALLLRVVRGVLLLRVSPSMHEELKQEYTEEEWSVVSHHAGASKQHINGRLLSALLEADMRIGSTRMPSVPLELAIMECAEHAG